MHELLRRRRASSTLATLNATEQQALLTKLSAPTARSARSIRRADKRLALEAISNSD